MKYQMFTRGNQYCMVQNPELCQPEIFLFLPCFVLDLHFESVVLSAKYREEKIVSTHSDLENLHLSKVGICVPTNISQMHLQHFYQNVSFQQNFISTF